MAMAVKRGRGRPRREEPQGVDENDILLVQEYQSRPVFYDRAHQHYRERDFVEHQWLDMAQKLNTSVALIKERLSSLRSRYYLEKRRLETTGVPSAWLLFEHLSFLGQHIKSRLSNIPLPIEKNVTLPEMGDYDDFQNSPRHAIKSSKIRGVDIHDTGSAQRMINNINGNSVSNSYSQYKNQNDGLKPVSKSLNMHQKYKAFGNFVACSLIDMDEKDALRLVEKFANELTKYSLAEYK